MTYQIVSLFMVLAMSYFASRFALRLDRFAIGKHGLIMAHVATGLALILLVVVVKFWSTGFSDMSVVKIALCQGICYGYDRLRGRYPGQSLG